MNVQLMVFNAAGERGEGEEIVLVNPRVSRYSRRIIPYEEGCLSFPMIHGDVKVLGPVNHSLSDRESIYCLTLCL